MIMPSGAPLLHYRDLAIDAPGGEPILRGIDLGLARGEVLGVIGESGAGKTSLGLAALGFIAPGCRIRRGGVSFEGIDLFALPEARRRALRGRRVAYVAQSAAASLNPALRIITQVTETAILAGQDPGAARVRAEALFAELRLPDPGRIGRSYPHQLSGGQLQRVMLAMALLCDPELIVFDEPTTALDVTTQVEVLAAIRGLLERSGAAGLYISHDLAVVTQMADRIAVMRHGELVEEAPTRHMLADPRADYTRTLWSVARLALPERPREGGLLEIAGVSAGYGPGARVLHGIDISVPRARTLALVGESGSGKSTLARVVAGLLPPTLGCVTFDGAPLPPDFRRRPRDLLRRIQFVYQSADTALNPRQRVRDLIGRRLGLYFGMKGPERAARVTELLEMVELDPRLAERFPHELSGGQKQRVAIARALATRPDLMICDEVTSALDQVVQAGILRLLARLQRETGVTYLFITHDLATVRAFADEVVVMHRGRVVEQGPREQVLSPPHADYTAQLLAAVPQMDPDWLTARLQNRQPSDSSKCSCPDSGARR